MSVEVGLKIKRIREYRNYTQQHVADKLELSQNAYCKIENGTTKLTTDRLESIATILDVPIETILSSEKQSFNLENKEILQKQIEYLQLQNEKLLQAIEKLTGKL